MRDTGQSSCFRGAARAGRAVQPRNIWHPIFIHAAVLLALAVMLTGCGQVSSQATGPRTTPTPTLAPLAQDASSGVSNSTAVGLTIGSGVLYAAVGTNGLYALRTSDGHLLWHHQIAGDISYEQPLAVNGIVYISSNANEWPGYVYALRASDGKQLWRFTGNGYVFLPTISGGVAYVSDQSGQIAALDTSDGHTLWRVNAVAPVDGSPLVANGMVYVSASRAYYNPGNAPGYIYALHTGDGRTLWRYTTDTPPTLSLVMNGAVYASTNNALFALRASDGHLLWRQSINTSIDPQPQVANGVMYFITTKVSLEGTPTTGSTGQPPPLGAASLLQSFMRMEPARAARPLKEGISSIYAVRMDDGAILWHYKLSPEGGNNWAQSLSIADNGVLYFSSFVDQNKGYIYAQRASDGALVYRHAIQNATPDNAALVGNVLYVELSTADGLISLHALRACDGTQYWQSQIDGHVLDPPVVHGDILYLGTDTGSIYALRASSGFMLWHYIATAGS